MQENLRRAPRQNRAADTVDVILEATAQLLDRPGSPAFTTNHVAQRAGVSVGTLYRYFSNKQGLLEALVSRELADRERQIIVHLNENPDAAPDAVIDFVADVALGSFRGRARVRRCLLGRLQGRSDIADLVHQTRFKVITLLEEHLVRVEPQTYRSLRTSEKLALAGAWIGAINTTLRYTQDDLEAEDLKAHLKKLLRSGLSH